MWRRLSRLLPLILALDWPLHWVIEETLQTVVFGIILAFHSTAEQHGSGYEGFLCHEDLVTQPSE